MSLHERRRRRFQRQGWRGFAVIMAAFLVVTFAVLGLGAVAILGGASQTLSDEYQSQQAFNVAQAGLAYIAKVLKEDSDWSNNGSVGMDFSPGSFSVIFIEQTVNSATVRSSGTVGGFTRTLQQSLTRGGLPAAFQNALYTESTINAGMSSSGTVTGNSTAAWAIHQGSLTFNGEVTPDHSAADVPEPNWSYWETVATTVISGHYDMAGTYSGIYYINGSVSITGDTTFDGTLVVRGPLSIGSAEATFTATDPNPAIITQGSINPVNTDHLIVNGWVVATGSFYTGGSSGLTISGGLMTTGDIGFSGATVNITHVPPGSAPPGLSGGEPGDSIVFGEWREVY